MAAPKLASHDEPGQTPTVADAAEAVRRASRGERVTVVAEDDRPLAVVVPLADLRRLQEDDRRRAAARLALEAIADRFDDADPNQVDRSVEDTVAALRGRTTPDDVAMGA